MYVQIYYLSGRERSARTPRVIKIVRERIRRKKNRSIRKTAADLNVSIGTAHTILTKDLGFRPYKKRKVHGVSEATSKKRLDRANRISARCQEFVFSDEKLFVLQQPHNVQNDRVWAPSRDSIPESNINIGSKVPRRWWFGGQYANVVSYPWCLLKKKRQNQRGVLQNWGFGKGCCPQSPKPLRRWALRVPAGRCTSPYGKCGSSLVSGQFNRLSGQNFVASQLPRTWILSTFLFGPIWWRSWTNTRSALWIISRR